MSERLSDITIKIALDFDGTVVERGHYPKIGPSLGAIPWLLKVQAVGAQFFLWTCRGGVELREAIEYLIKAGVELHEPEFLDGAIKPIADMYLDDCNFEAMVGQRGLVWEYVGPNLLAAIIELKELKSVYSERLEQRRSECSGK